MPSESLKPASFVDYVYRFLEQLKVVQHKSEHTIRCYTADLNNLKILSRGAPFQQDVVDLAIHQCITY